MNALRITVGVLVTAVWVAVYTASIIDRNFTAPPEVSGVMLFVVTYCFGTGLRDTISRKVKASGQKVLDSIPDPDTEEPHDERP